MPGKVRVQFCHFCFAAPSIQNTWRKILLPPRRAAKVRADARPPAACTPARVVRGRLPTWGAGRARWQPGAPKQVFPFPGPPGPELKTVFIAFIYSFGNEVRDDRVTFPLTNTDIAPRVLCQLKSEVIA